MSEVMSAIWANLAGDETLSMSRPPCPVSAGDLPARLPHMPRVIEKVWAVNGPKMWRGFELMKPLPDQTLQIPA
jgi:hypothetical protein